MGNDFPRGSEEPTFGPDSADRSIEPYGTAAVKNPRYGLDQGSIKASGSAHDRDFEANTADGRASRTGGLSIPAKSGAVPAPDAEPNGAEGQTPYGTARNPIPRGSINRVPNG